MEQRLPWYVRVKNVFDGKFGNLIANLILECYFLLMFVCGYVCFKNVPPMKSYDKDLEVIYRLTYAMLNIMPICFTILVIIYFVAMGIDIAATKWEKKQEKQLNNQI